MTLPAVARQALLTPYETEQVEQIALFKSQPPNPLSEMWKRLTLPGAQVIDKLIPDRWVSAGIEKAYNTAARLAGAAEIMREAGVESLADLRRKPLEECDRLASLVATDALLLATIEGAATGAGGVFTTLLDVPLLFILSLRTIMKIGHCYGYSLEGSGGQQYTLGVLVAAVSGTPQTRQERLNRLRDVEDLLIEDTEEEIAAEELTSVLFQLEIFEEIPGLGAISGGILNMAFVRRVEITARRVFQERWLRDHGKIDWIDAAPAHPRHAATGWTGALRRAAYSGCYAIGFGVAVPVHVAASLIRPFDVAIRHGIKERDTNTVPGRAIAGETVMFHRAANGSRATSLA